MNNQPPPIQVKITDDILRCVYANTMQVSHTPEEFTLDFMYLDYKSGMCMINCRIITSPGHLKRIIDALKDNLEKYEKNFGSVKESEDPGNAIGFKAA